MCPVVALLLTSFPTTSHSQVTLTQLEGRLNTDEEKLYVLLDRAEYKYTNLAYSALNLLFLTMIDHMINLKTEKELSPGAQKANLQPQQDPSIPWLREPHEDRDQGGALRLAPRHRGPRPARAAHQHHVPPRQV